MRINAWRGDRVGSGTGFFLFENGFIATAYHVIHGASRVDVVVNGRSGKVTHRDVLVYSVRPNVDLAYLWIETPLAATSHYRSAPATPPGPAGTEVFVHGLPLGFDNQLLSARLTQVGYRPSQEWFNAQGKSLFGVYDVSLIPLDVIGEPGVSGAPVLDRNGQAIGVFSGSLATGRGYAWAIPISYFDNDRMTMISQRASNITQWPQFDFMRAGVHLARSLDPTSPRARGARKCRLVIEEYADSWTRQLDAAHRAQMGISMLMPVVSSIRSTMQQADPASTSQRLRAVWEQLEPRIAPFNQGQLDFERKSAALMTACYSQSTLAKIGLADLPATYRNTLANLRFRRRLDDTHETQAEMERSGGVIEAKMEELLLEVFELGQRVENTSTTSREGVSAGIKLIDALARVIELFLSVDQARLIEANIRMGSRWVEILEAIELHPWETQHQSYTYRHANLFDMTLQGGWIHFDSRLRELARKKDSPPLPASIKLLDFGTIEEEQPILLAEVHGSLYPNYSASQSGTDLSRYWRIVNEGVQAIRTEIGKQGSPVERYESFEGGYLHLELTTSFEARPGLTIYTYVGSKFGPSGHAMVLCYIKKAGVPWDRCSGLVRSVRFVP